MRKVLAEAKSKKPWVDLDEREYTNTKQLLIERAELVAEIKRLCIEIPKLLGSNVPMKNDLLRKLGEQ